MVVKICIPHTLKNLTILKSWHPDSGLKTLSPENENPELMAEP